MNRRQLLGTAAGALRLRGTYGTALARGGAMSELLHTPEALDEVVVFVGEAASSAGGLAWALECLGYVTARALSVSDIDSAHPWTVSGR